MVYEFISQNKTVYLHIFALSLLSAICIWNIVNITNDFIYDNRLTIVKVENVNETFPFLKYTPITLQIAAFPTIFPDVWSLIDHPGDIEEKLLQDSSKTVDYFSLNQSVLEDRVKTGLLFRDLKFMDEQVIACILAPYGKRACDQMPLYAHFDPVLQNGTALESLQETAWDYLKNHVTGPFRILENISNVHLSYSTGTAVQVEIDPFSILSRQKSVFDFYSGIAISEKWIRDQIRNESSPAIIKIWLKIQDFTAGPFVIDQNKETRINLNIENIGVFDKTLTTQCSDEPEIFMDLGEKNCTSKKYLTALLKKCKCQPFSLRKKAQKLRAFSENLPFCTSAIYEKCIEDLRVIDEECLPNCIDIKNQYSVTSTTSEGYSCINAGVEGVNGQKCGLAEIRIGCTSNNYAIYENRIKLSAAQFVSQIGGDLGLYIGISALGIWNFIMSLIQRYTKYKEAGKRRGRRPTIKKLAQQTLRSALIGTDETETDEYKSSGDAELGQLMPDHWGHGMEKMKSEILREMNERFLRFEERMERRQ